jgi:hypothetical protein
VITKYRVLANFFLVTDLIANQVESSPLKAPVSAMQRKPADQAPRNVLL